MEKLCPPLLEPERRADSFFSRSGKTGFRGGGTVERTPGVIEAHFGLRPSAAGQP